MIYTRDTILSINENFYIQQQYVERVNELCLTYLNIFSKQVNEGVAFSINRKR